MLVPPDKERAAYLDNAFEADILRQVLADEQLPAVIRSNDSLAYGELFQSQQGWGAVYAAPKYHAAIQALLAEVRAAVPVEDELTRMAENS